MKRYKLLTQDGYAAFNFEVGKVYAGTAKSKAGLTVSFMARAYPDDWQLIEEKQKKHIDEHYKDWCGEHHTVNSCHPVHDSAEACDFAEYYHKQLIEEKQEMRPIMTYVILSVMMALYLYAGLAEINWPLIPATVMGFYLLIKIERYGRKQVL